MKTYTAALQPIRKAFWHARSSRYLASHPAERQAIRLNLPLRGTHQGERCFILGNGPSLLDEDLTLLNGETLFSVNNLDAQELGAPPPRYHVISDRRFFSMGSDSVADRAMASRLAHITSREGVASSQPPTTFVPSSELGKIEELSGARVHDVRYFCNPYYFSDYYQISDNLSRVIPRFSSVIQHCIVVAIHLGFRQIYLLGCDTTNIVANVQTAMEESADSSYAYSVSPETDQWLRNQYRKRDMERCAESYLEVLMAFRFLSSYCQSRGVELVNCSSRTVVDSIVRARLRDLL